jgi:hypothetical protein
MPVPPKLEPFLRELGRLVLNFNSAENSLRRLLWLLIDAGDDRIGQVVTDGLDLVRTTETIRALLLRRKVSADLITSIGDAIARFDKLRLVRNQFAHGVWRIPNDAVDLRDVHAARAPGRRADSYQKVPGSGDSATIAKAANEAVAVSELLDAAISNVRNALISRSGAA